MPIPAPRADRIIRHWLEVTGGSQSDLARHLGWSRLTVNHYYRRRRIPGPENLRQLTEALKDALSVEVIP